MPSPDNTSIAPAFAVENPIGTGQPAGRTISQSITFAPPPSVEYGRVGIPNAGAPAAGDGMIAVTLAPGDQLQVVDGGSGHTEANKSGEATYVVNATDNTYVNSGANPTGDITVNYEQVGESIVSATVAAITTNTFNAGDQIRVQAGLAAAATDARLMIPADFN